MEGYQVKESIRASICFFEFAWIAWSSFVGPFPETVVDRDLQTKNLFGFLDEFVHIGMALHFQPERSDAKVSIALKYVENLFQFEREWLENCVVSVTS